MSLTGKQFQWFTAVYATQTWFLRVYRRKPGVRGSSPCVIRAGADHGYHDLIHARREAEDNRAVRLVHGVDGRLLGVDPGRTPPTRTLHLNTQ